MSRAFVKEEDPDAPVHLPDRAISDLPNYMTEKGFSQMQASYRDLEGALKALDSASDLSTKTRIAEIKREMRYVSARLRTAEIIQPSTSDKVRFGCQVHFVDDMDQVYAYRIVGEDEADVNLNLISWASPLAKLLTGKSVGAELVWKKAGCDVPIEITQIDF